MRGTASATASPSNQSTSSNRQSTAPRRFGPHPMAAGTEGGRERGQGEEEVRRPGGRAQRIVESVLQRLVQRVRGYFPFVAKYISISPSMITKATAAATGP